MPSGSITVGAHGVIVRLRPRTAHRAVGHTAKGANIARLQDLTKGALVSGVVADAAVTVIDVTMHGSDVLTLTYRTPDGMVAERLIYRDDEPLLTIVEEGKPWAFDGNGEAFKLASEASTFAYLARLVEAAYGQFGLQ